MPTPMFPAHLEFTQPPTRRKRVSQGQHRTWEIRARYGTADTDRWTLIGTPIPGADNPAASIEDGQFATLKDAHIARLHAELCDDGTHLEE